MKPFIWTLLLFINVVNSQNSIDNFDYNIIIDKNIQDTTEQKIALIKDNILPDYKAHIEIEFYENGNLKGEINSIDTGNSRVYFYKENDTVKINGNYGLFEFTGILKEKRAHIITPISSLDIPRFSLDEKSELKMEINVPCEIINFTTSEYPNPESNNILFGYLEFKTNDFYKADKILNKIESTKRKKISMKMKIYFKSKFIEKE